MHKWCDKYKLTMLKGKMLNSYCWKELKVTNAWNNDFFLYQCKVIKFEQFNEKIDKPLIILWEKLEC